MIQRKAGSDSEEIWARVAEKLSVGSYVVVAQCVREFGCHLGVQVRGTPDSQRT